MADEEHKKLIKEAKRLWDKKRKVEECPFIHFEPWGDQLGFMESTCQIRLITGGNRSGKTTVGFVEMMSQVLGYRPD